MGLAQRRIVEDYKTTAFPKWKADFDGVVGFDIPIEVKWDNMMSDDYSSKDDYFSWYNQVFFIPLMTVFKLSTKFGP